MRSFRANRYNFAPCALQAIDATKGRGVVAGRKPLRARCARHSAQRGAPRRSRRRRADRRDARHAALGKRCTSLCSMTAVSILLMIRELRNHAVIIIYRAKKSGICTCTCISPSR